MTFFGQNQSNEKISHHSKLEVALNKAILPLKVENFINQIDHHQPHLPLINPHTRTFLRIVTNLFSVKSMANVDKMYFTSGTHSTTYTIPMTLENFVSNVKRTTNTSASAHMTFDIYPYNLQAYNGEDQVIPKTLITYIHMRALDYP